MVLGGENFVVRARASLKWRFFVCRDHFLKWIESLADRQTPAWLGLPNNAEKVLLTTRGTDLISKLLKMQQLEDDDELAYKVRKRSEFVRKTKDVSMICFTSI